jgi:hypothetical protein
VRGLKLTGPCVMGTGISGDGDGDLRKTPRGPLDKHYKVPNGVHALILLHSTIHLISESLTGLYSLKYRLYLLLDMI